MKSLRSFSEESLCIENHLHVVCHCNPDNKLTEKNSTLIYYLSMYMEYHQNCQILVCSNYLVAICHIWLAKISMARVQFTGVQKSPFKIGDKVGGYSVPCCIHHNAS